MRDVMMRALLAAQQQQQQQDQATLANAARQPIPGLTGAPGAGVGIPGVGMAPPQQPPAQQHQPFMSSGPYGRQAMHMAGLLGNPPPTGGPSGAGNIQTQIGLLGGPPKGLRIPFYRPPGK